MSDGEVSPLDGVSDQDLVDELAGRCDDLIVLMQRNVAETGRKPHTCDIFRAGNPFTHCGMVVYAKDRTDAAIKTETIQAG